jgi:transcriptional regulator with XRE-family HTH domain
MAHALATHPTTGDELAWTRRLAGVSQAQVAAQMGVLRQRVSAIEGMARPSRQAIRRYIAALQAADALADEADQ